MCGIVSEQFYFVWHSWVHIFTWVNIMSHLALATYTVMYRIHTSARKKRTRKNSFTEKVEFWLNFSRNKYNNNHNNIMLNHNAILVVTMIIVCSLYVRCAVYIFCEFILKFHWLNLFKFFAVFFLLLHILYLRFFPPICR